MALNTELFAKIYDIITDGDGVPRRQTFSMDTWEHSCGTSRCVAGWAVHLETGQPLFERDGGAHRSTLDLAQELGLWTSPLSWEHLGAALLGLTGRQPGLFYLNPDRAVELVRLAAEGDEAGFNTLLAEFEDVEL